MLTKEELAEKLTGLGTAQDDAERRVLITELTDGLNEILDANNNLQAANTKFEADNKKLQEYNMQLFLKVGSQTKQPEVQAEPERETPKYEDLFNDKGELK